MSAVRCHLGSVSAAAALVVFVTGCAASSTARNANPPKLHIGTGAQLEARGAAPMISAVGGVGEYVLAGPLPTQPTHAPVWRWPTKPTTSADVARLATALGIIATPQRHAHGWVVRSPSGELRVRDGDGAPWSFARADLASCPPMMVDVDRAGQNVAAAGCAVAVASSVAVAGPGITPPPPPPPPPGPDDATTRTAAQPVLAALGTAGTQRVEPGGPGVSTLSVAPRVGSMATQGLDMRIEVDGRGIRAARGYLQPPETGDDYPLRTARSAFDDLARQPHPMIARYCGPVPPTASAGPAGCPPPKPTRVTGATLGLQLRWDKTGSLLVPAWFFRVEGSTWPLTVIAIDPAFIDSPVTASPTAVRPSVGGAAGGAVGGVVGDGAVGQVQTSPSAPAGPPSFAPVPATS